MTTPDRPTQDPSVWLAQAVALDTPVDFEFALRAERFRVVRFLHDRIHQDWFPAVDRISVRSWRDGKLGLIARNGLGSPGELLAQAVAHEVEADLSACPFAAASGPAPIQETGSAPSDADVDGVVWFLQEEAQRRGLEMAGAAHRIDVTNHVVTSLGARTGFRQQYLYVRLLLRQPGDGLPGYAERIWRTADEVDPGALFQEAAGYAALNRSPQPLEPGSYDLLLEPVAAAELLRYLNTLGLNGARDNKGTNFLTRRAHIGEVVASEQLTLWDDGTDPRGLVTPFDFEGTSKSRIPLIEEGRLCALLYDRASAATAGKASTGHGNALFGGYVEEGPVGYNLFVAPGPDTWDAILAQTARGLWIHRFQYSYLTEPELGIITASTRDGTFRVEKGRVEPVTDVRLVMSLSEALKRIDAIADTARLCFDWWAPGSYINTAYAVPPLRISGIVACPARHS
jgi:PmbA protein